MTTEHTTEATEALQSGAYNRWLGAYLVRASADAVELHLPYRDEFGTAHGSIHHGVVAALAEIAGRAALRAAGLGDAPAPAVRLDHLADAAAGNELHAHARIINQRVFVDIRTNDDRALVASAVLDAASRRLIHRDAAFVQPHYPV